MAWVKHSLSNSESQHAAYGKIWKNDGKMKDIEID